MLPSIKYAIIAAISRLDVAAATSLINQAYGSDLTLEISLMENWHLPSGVVVWQVESSSNGRLWIDRDFEAAARLTHTLPLFQAYHRQGNVQPGCVAVNLGDAGELPGIAFCTNRAEFTLVPDAEFIDFEGYQATRLAYAEADVPWDERKPVAFWRGATTGQKGQSGWRSLPRVRLCKLGDHPALFDVGLSNIVQIDDPKVVAEVKESGLMRDHVPVEQFNKFKYQIDIDGNSNSWPGLFQKLLSGSPVLKVSSERGYRQWYYDRLVPWENYVPVEADMSDLRDRVLWLLEHDDLAREIGARGRALAESMDYPGELARIAPSISNAIKRCELQMPQSSAQPSIIGQAASLTRDLMFRLHGTDIYADFVPELAADHQGWNSHHPVFDEIISEFKPVVVIDVGVWKGASTLYLADLIDRYVNNGTVIAIDTFLGSLEHNIVDSELFNLIPRRHGRPLLYEQFISNIVLANAQHRVVPLVQTSSSGGLLLRQAAVKAGLIHIDASHEYEDVLHDARGYWELLEPGGFLVGDDYHASWPGVVRAADEFAAEMGVELIVRDPKWIVRKPETRRVAPPVDNALTVTMTVSEHNIQRGTKKLFGMQRLVSQGNGTAAIGPGYTRGSLHQLPPGAIGIQFVLANMLTDEMTIYNAAYALSTGINDWVTPLNAQGIPDNTLWVPVTASGSTDMTVVPAPSANQPSCILTDVMPFMTAPPERLDGGSGICLFFRLCSTAGTITFQTFDGTVGLWNEFNNGQSPGQFSQTFGGGWLNKANNCIISGFDLHYQPGILSTHSVPHAVLPVMGKPSLTIMSVGDSILSGVGARGAVDAGINGMGFQLAKALNRSNRPVFHVNDATSARSSVDFIANAISTLTTMIPDVIFLQTYSANDPDASTHQGVWAAWQRTMTFAAKAMAEGSHVVLVTSPPFCGIGSFREASVWEAPRRYANSLVMESGLPYIDCDKILGTGSVPVGFKSGYSNDLVHPNDLAASQLASAAIAVLIADGIQ